MTKIEEIKMFLLIYDQYEFDVGNMFIFNNIWSNNQNHDLYLIFRQINKSKTI